jgi:hypothetical protein
MQFGVQLPDWPGRPMTVVKTCRVVVGETRDEVLEAAQRTYAMRRKAREAQIEQPGHPLAPMITFEEFVKRTLGSWRRWHGCSCRCTTRRRTRPKRNVK